MCLRLMPHPVVIVTNFEAPITYIYYIYNVRIYIYIFALCGTKTNYNNKESNLTNVKGQNLNDRNKDNSIRVTGSCDLCTNKREF